MNILSFARLLFNSPKISLYTSYIHVLPLFWYWGTIHTISGGLVRAPQRAVFFSTRIAKIYVTTKLLDNPGALINCATFYSNRSTFLYTQY
jgi:hypothetical protein